MASPLLFAPPLQPQGVCICSALCLHSLLPHLLQARMSPPAATAPPVPPLPSPSFTISIDLLISHLALHINLCTRSFIFYPCSSLRAGSLSAFFFFFFWPEQCQAQSGCSMTICALGLDSQPGAHIPSHLHLPASPPPTPNHQASWGGSQHPSFNGSLGAPPSSFPLEPLTVSLAGRGVSA